MRILILNWRDVRHPLAGGAEISTHEHAKRWVKAGHQVTQLSSSITGGKSSEILDGVSIIRMGNHYTVHLRAFIHYFLHLRDKVDLVIDEFHFIPFFTPLYCRKKKIAFIHETAEEVWFKNHFFPINFIGYFLEPLFFYLYRNIHFITVSDSTKNDLIKFGIKKEYIYIIYNGIVSIRSAEKKEKSPTMICLGRLAEDKGTKDAILAFFEVQKAFPDSSLWIVGKEEKCGMEDYIRKLTKKLSIEKKVIFFGFVQEKEKYDLLKRAWILINPSVKEGWGLTVIEAASQGTPGIAYDVSGLRDSIQDDKTGLLVKEKKPEKLAEKIILLLRNKPWYDKLSKQSFEWSKKFVWKKASKESLEFIEKI